MSVRRNTWVLMKGFNSVPLPFKFYCHQTYVIWTCCSSCQRPLTSLTMHSFDCSASYTFNCIQDVLIKHSKVNFSLLFLVLLFYFKNLIKLHKFVKKLQYLRHYLFTYLLTYVLTYILTYLHNYLLTYLITYLLTHLITYLLTYLLTYLPT